MHYSLFELVDAPGRHVEALLVTADTGLHATLDRDDSFWSREYEARVCIMRYDHELGKDWTAQDSIKCHLEVDDIEEHLLYTKMLHGAKRDNRVTYPMGSVEDPETIPWKNYLTGLNEDLGILRPPKASVKMTLRELPPSTSTRVTFQLAMATVTTKGKCPG